MRKPVLDHKFGNSVEELALAPIGTESVFTYKDEVWTITLVGLTEEDLPMFTIDIEARGDWHEQF